MGQMEVPLASLSLTHVNYNPEDPVSYISAFLALVPQALCVVYVALIWASREVEVLLMFTGQMLCEAFNFVLKRIIREERPTQMFGKGYGMPSSHSQFVGYFAVSLALFLLVRHVPDTATNRSSASLAYRTTFSAVVFIVSLAVAAGRIYLNYHTPKQVMAGYIVGMACAFAWFLLLSYLRNTGWIDWAVDSEISKRFRIRDLLVEEDLAEGGWQRWQSKRNAKGRKRPKAPNKSK